MDYARILKGPKDDAAGVATMVMNLFHARTYAHILHLQSRSFSQHMALNTLYDELPGLVDSFVESYQGLHGVIPSYPTEIPPKYPTQEPLSFVAGVSSMLASLRTSVVETELQNILDEIATLLNSTSYKLQNLN